MIWTVLLLEKGFTRVSLIWRILDKILVKVFLIYLVEVRGLIRTA